MTVNKHFAAIFDKFHLRYSNVASTNAKVQAVFGFAPVLDNPPIETEDMVAIWDGFVMCNNCIMNDYRYEQLPNADTEEG